MATAYGSVDTGSALAAPSVGGPGSSCMGPTRQQLYLGRTITKKTLLFRGLRLKVRLSGV